MTALTDLKAITPTTNAAKVGVAAGANVAGLMTLLQTHLAEAQILLKQIIALAPGGDANLTALNALLAEIA